jgi:predicted metal-dependent HD superfamily phosphohydrolase
MTTGLEKYLFQSWQRSLQSFRVNQAKAQNAFTEIVQAYSGPSRSYHTLKHINHVLSTIQCLQDQVQALEIVQLAAWFHDIVYDTHTQDNEEQSAHYAGEVLRSLDISSDAIAAVQRLIWMTKHHQAPADDVDAQILLDADLAILGANLSDYQAYAQAIRQEYIWVPEARYLVGRQQVLETFLQRDRIYFTTLMFETAEQSSRANLTAEIQLLQTQILSI